MEVSRKHKILLISVAAFGLFVLFGGIAVVIDGNTKASGGMEGSKPPNVLDVQSAVDQIDEVLEDSKGSISVSQNQEINTSVTNTQFSLFKLDRRNIIILSVMGFLLLTATAIAVTMGILYQQKLPTDSVPFDIHDREMQKKFTSLQEELEILKDEKEQREIVEERDAKMAQAKAEYWFNVRIGVFVGMVAIGVIISILGFYNNKQPSKSPTKGEAILSFSITQLRIFLFILEGVIVAVMSLVDIPIGGFYCAAAFIFSFFADYFFSSFLPFWSISPKIQNLNRLLRVANAISAIIFLVGPIIHMSVVGA